MSFTQIAVIYLIVINILGFLIMGLDKHKAKMAERRIPENTLFTFTVLGGGIGTIAGMYVFHHKTKKMKFKVGMPLVLILEILIFVYFKYFKKSRYSV